MIWVSVPAPLLPEHSVVWTDLQKHSELTHKPKKNRIRVYLIWNSQRNVSPVNNNKNVFCLKNTFCPLLYLSLSLARWVVCLQVMRHQAAVCVCVCKTSQFRHLAVSSVRNSGVLMIKRELIPKCGYSWPHDPEVIWVWVESIDTVYRWRTSPQPLLLMPSPNPFPNHTSQ